MKIDVDSAVNILFVYVQVVGLEVYCAIKCFGFCRAQNADAAPEPGGNGTAVPSEPTVLPSIATPIKYAFLG